MDFAKGLFSSSDKGKTWKLTDLSKGLTSSNVISVLVLGTTILLGTEFGLSLSRDSGLTWTKKTKHDGFTSKEVLDFSVSESQVPNPVQTIYAATAEGVFVSKDQGETWVQRIVKE